jgi:hypothetical protein
LVDPLEVVERDEDRAQAVDRTVRRLEHAHRIEASGWRRLGRDEAGHVRRGSGEIAEETHRGGQGYPAFGLIAKDGEVLTDPESVTSLAQEPTLSLAGLPDNQDTCGATRAAHIGNGRLDRGELAGPANELSHHRRLHPG